MSHWYRMLTLSSVVLLLSTCGGSAQLPVSAGFGPDPELPEPRQSLIPVLNFVRADGWPEGQMPQAADGTSVNAFARDLQNPRWLYVLPNGDVLVAESNAPADNMPGGIRSRVAAWLMARSGSSEPSADRITLLRDSNQDGVADERHVFLDGLHSPFGMALLDDQLYVANADALMVFDYTPGQNRIETQGRLVTDLRRGSINYHWTKNVVVSPDGERLYVSIGSNSNIAEFGLEEELERAAIWEINPDTGEYRVYADGLRNPVGMSWHPETDVLWTVVNERDELGSDLVPDYLTSVQDGGFYGWPWSYFGDHVDERVEPARPDRVAEALVPDYALGNHTASLGLTWLPEGRLPGPFGHGMLVGQRGSWNRRPHSGYQVIFIPFRDGGPQGQPIELLSGFRDGNTAYGRPVGVALSNQGDVLVADDAGGHIWRVSTSQ